MDLIRGMFSNSSSEIDSDANEDRGAEPLPQSDGRQPKMTACVNWWKKL
jgi:hypothetical protein